ncbi:MULTISPECIES: SusE domain-containing protein [Chitinophagaceae]
MNILNHKIKSLFVGAIVLSLAACNKQGTDVVFPDSSGTAPVLNASVSDSIPLYNAIKDNSAVTFNWTNPNYTFSNGISSMNVTYNIEVDTLGANFTNPKIQTVQVTSALDTTLTVEALNSLVANGLGLSLGQQHTIQVRVQSFISPYSSGSANIGTLTSNALSFKVIPYTPPPKITPPAAGTLFIVGSATAGGWDNPMTVNPATQQFTRVSNTEYTITIPLIGSGEYKFIGTNGSWNEQWSVATQDTYPNGGPFVLNGANCQAPGASGTYKIDVNFQTGIFTVTKQ